MSKERRNQRIRCWALPCLMMITISFFSSDVTPQPPQSVFSAHDKLSHLAVFGLLATGFFRAARFDLSQRVATVLAILLTSLFGLADEIHQGLTPGRYMEFNDWIADTLGAVIAVYAYRAWPFYQKCLEFKLSKHSPKSS